MTLPKIDQGFKTDEMEVVFERIQTAQHSYLDELLSLYRESFPPEERRITERLLGMLAEPQMYFSAIISGKEPAGLIIYWIFDGFVYLEHLAVSPAMRGKGIGEEALIILQQTGLPILLEVEIPLDSEGLKRMNFYHKCGFSTLKVPYVQPPYREGESTPDMMLFSDKADWEAEILTRFIGLFQTEVYYSRH